MLQDMQNDVVLLRDTQKNEIFWLTKWLFKFATGQDLACTCTSEMFKKISMHLSASKFTQAHCLPQQNAFCLFLSHIKKTISFCMSYSKLPPYHLYCVLFSGLEPAASFTNELSYEQNSTNGEVIWSVIVWKHSAKDDTKMHWDRTFVHTRESHGPAHHAGDSWYARWQEQVTNSKETKIHQMKKPHPTDCMYVAKLEPWTY